MNPERAALRSTIARRVAAIAAGICIAAAAFVATFRALSPSQMPLKVVWSAGESATPPEGFRLLAFPLGEAQVRAAPEGEPIRALERALLNSLEESVPGTWVRVRDAGEVGWVRSDELTHELPAGRTSSALVRTLSETVAARSPGLRLNVSEREPGVVTILLAGPDETRRWTYSVEGAVVSPIAYEYANRMSKAKQDVSAIAPALSVGLAAGLVTVVLLRKSMR